MYLYVCQYGYVRANVFGFCINFGRCLFSICRYMRVWVLWQFSIYSVPNIGVTSGAQTQAFSCSKPTQIQAFFFFAFLFTYSHSHACVLDRHTYESLHPSSNEKKRKICVRRSTHNEIQLKMKTLDGNDIMEGERRNGNINRWTMLYVTLDETNFRWYIFCWQFAACFVSSPPRRHTLFSKHTQYIFHFKWISGKMRSIRRRHLFFCSLTWFGLDYVTNAHHIRTHCEPILYVRCSVRERWT